MTRPQLPFRIGNYRVEKQLGSGGMGAVYRGFDEALQVYLTAHDS